MLSIVFLYNFCLFRNNPGMRQEFDFKDILHIYETDSKWSVSFRTYGEYDLAHGVSLLLHYLVLVIHLVTFLNSSFWIILWKQNKGVPKKSLNVDDDVTLLQPFLEKESLIPNIDSFQIYLYSFDGLLGLDMYPIITWYHNYEILYFSVKETYTTSDASQLSIRYLIL